MIIGLGDAVDAGLAPGALTGALVDDEIGGLVAGVCSAAEA